MKQFTKLSCLMVLACSILYNEANAALKKCIPEVTGYKQVSIEYVDDYPNNLKRYKVTMEGKVKIKHADGSVSEPLDLSTIINHYVIADNEHEAGGQAYPREIINNYKNSQCQTNECNNK